MRMQWRAETKWEEDDRGWALQAKDQNKFLSDGGSPAHGSRAVVKRESSTWYIIPDEWDQTKSTCVIVPPVHSRPVVLWLDMVRDEQNYAPRAATCCGAHLIYTRHTCHARVRVEQHCVVHVRAARADIFDGKMSA